MCCDRTPRIRATLGSVTQGDPEHRFGAVIRHGPNFATQSIGVEVEGDGGTWVSNPVPISLVEHA